MPTHTRIRMFNTKETYPNQVLDNDLCQAVRAGNTVYVRGQVGTDFDGKLVGLGDPRAQAEQASRAGKASAAARRAGKGKGSAAAKAAAPAAEAGGFQQDATPVERPLNDRTTNQNQNQNQNHICSSNNRHADDAVVPASHGEWMRVFDEAFGVEVDPASLQHRQKFVPLAKGWIDAGVSVGQMRDAVAKARSEAKEGIAYLPSYVDRVLASMSAGAAVVAAAQAGESFATKDYGTKVVVL